MNPTRLAATRTAQARFTASRKAALIRQTEQNVKALCLHWARTVEQIAAMSPADPAYMGLVDYERRAMTELRAEQDRLKRLDPSNVLV